MKTVILWSLFSAVIGSWQTPRENFDYLESVNDDDDTLREEDLIDFIKDVDNDGDGSLDFNEFIISRPSSETTTVSEDAFQFFDRLDGTVDNKISPSVAIAFISKLDENNDNDVSYKEFKKNLHKIKEEIVPEEPKTIKCYIEGEPIPQITDE